MRNHPCGLRYVAIHEGDDPQLLLGSCLPSLVALSVRSGGKLAAQHLHDIQQRIRQLARFERELGLAVKQWKRSKQPELAANEFCSLIERTMLDQAKTGKRR